MLVISYKMVSAYPRWQTAPIEFCGKFKDWESFERFKKRQKLEGRTVTAPKLECTVEG